MTLRAAFNFLPPINREVLGFLSWEVYEPRQRRIADLLNAEFSITEILADCYRVFGHNYLDETLSHEEKVRQSRLRTGALRCQQTSREFNF
jgi:hypothetical protein